MVRTNDETNNNAMKNHSTIMDGKKKIVESIFLSKSLTNPNKITNNLHLNTSSIGKLKTD